MDVVKALHRAREAYERREWLTAYKTLSDLDNNLHLMKVHGLKML